MVLKIAFWVISGFAPWPNQPNPSVCFQSPVIQTNQSFGTPIQNFATPGSAVKTTPNQTPAKILLSPPALPPRDTAKGPPAAGHQQPAANNNNPFGSPAFGSQDPFGMPTWNTPASKVTGKVLKGLNNLSKMPLLHLSRLELTGRIYVSNSLNFSF